MRQFGYTVKADLAATTAPGAKRPCVDICVPYCSPPESPSRSNGSVPDSGNEPAQIVTRTGHWPHDRSGAYKQTCSMTAFERLSNRRKIHQPPLWHDTAELTIRHHMPRRPHNPSSSQPEPKSH